MMQELKEGRTEDHNWANHRGVNGDFMGSVYGWNGDIYRQKYLNNTKEAARSLHTED